MPRRLSEITTRQYLSAQTAFQTWLVKRGVMFPAPMATVALYLRHVGRTRGVTSVVVHRAAVKRLYRESGILVDWEAPEVQRVSTRASARALAQREARS